MLHLATAQIQALPEVLLEPADDVDGYQTDFTELLSDS